MIFDKKPGTRLCAVRPDWKQFPVVLIACGPSLTQQQIHAVRVARESGTIRVITINDAYLWAPWSDVEYFADAKFWRWHFHGIPKPALGLSAAQVAAKFSQYAGEKCSISSSMTAITDPAVAFLRNASQNAHGWGLSVDPESIVTGRHSGYQALNIAFLSGAKKIMLLGYDCRPNKKGETHFHGGHPVATPANSYMHYLRAFTMAERAIAQTGVDVVNCSPGSAIGAFRFSDIETELEDSNAPQNTGRVGTG